MGSIKVILRDDVATLGEMGDVKLVKSGYARNFLFPRRLAVDYSTENKKILVSQKKLIEKKKMGKIENSNQLKEKVENEKISIFVPAGEKGRLYGTVTVSQIADELNKKDYGIDKKKIELKEHIKFVGMYKYRIHLYQDIYANMQLEVIAEKKKDRTAKNKKEKKDEDKETPSAEEAKMETKVDVEVEVDEKVNVEVEVDEKVNVEVEVDEKVNVEVDENKSVD